MRAALLMLGAALLVVAWIPATLPFGAPDETAHYLRALNIANGHILGPHIPYTTSLPIPALEEAWASRNNRAVTVPARLNPPNVPCLDGKHNVSGSCVEETDSGNYPPLPYLLPAVGLGVSHDSATAIWLARVGSALPAIAFLLLALALVWGGTGWSVLGFLAAISPAVLWVSAIMNPSGMQIAACLAFMAALIRILRAPADAPAWKWVALTASGVVAMNAGGIGLEFVIIDLLVFGALAGPRRLRELRGIADRWTLRISALTLIAGALAAIIYSHVAGLSATVRISPLLPGLHKGVVNLPGVLEGAVGIFGALTIFLPNPAYWLWWLAVLGLVAAALWLGDRRERLVVAGVTIFAVAFPILFEAWVDRWTGFWLQGREVLPVLMLAPLAAGEVVYVHRSRFAARRWAPPALGGAIALFAAYQAYAWWHDARIVAGAANTIRFYAHAVWSPPGGWLPWVASAVVGTYALLAYASTEAFPGRRRRTTRRSAGHERAAV